VSGVSISRSVESTVYWLSGVASMAILGGQWSQSEEIAEQRAKSWIEAVVDFCPPADEDEEQLAQAYQVAV